MSKAAKLTFLSSCVFAVGTIWFVHKAQESERESMYQGVIRDQERKAQREKNIREFDETRALHAQLIQEQPDVGSAAAKGGPQQ
ncbi:hypothetical protein GQ54DRAFT_258310 [Martensiomyces pterosporus]|nr:hypothetical protein GQ54DRAFT_258310 [Martensiomyces pterosporus]